MSEHFLEAPTIALEAPTPTATEFKHAEEYQPPSPRSLPMSISSSASSSRPGTASSSLSSSYRHHPYSSSAESHRPRMSRSRSATSASDQDQSDWSEGLAGEGNEMEMDEGHDASLALLNFSLELDTLPPLPAIPNSASTSATASPSSSASPSKPSKAKGPKAKTSHARKTPPGHIKRPPNAFIIFRSHCCAPDQVGPDGVIPPGTPTAQQLAELGITDHRHISRIVSHLWKSLKPGEKAYWEGQAQKRKDEHAAAHPDYRYKPVYRNKDEVRRRRKGGRDETEEERLACEKLASELLGIDVAAKDAEEAAEKAKKPKKSRAKIKVAAGTTSTGRPRWTIDTVTDALLHPEIPVHAAPAAPVVPRRRGPRRKAAEPASRPKPAFADFDESYDEDCAQYPQHQQHHYDAQYAPRSTRPYASQAEADFARPYYPTRRESHTRTQVTQGPDESYQFGYMHQLDEFIAQQGGPSIVDPRQLDSAPSSRPQTASYHDVPSLSPQEHLERVSSSRKGPPAPLDLPYNPSFVGYPPAPDFPPSQEQAPAPAYGRPPSPRSLAINRMQHYSIATASNTSSTTPTPRPASPQRSSNSSHPSSDHSTDANHVVISPTSRTFSFSDLGPGLPASVPLRRDSEFGHSAAAIMGMKRRGTLRASGTEGGDLMLISPVTGTFGGRKFSLGRWELPRKSVGGAGEAMSGTSASTLSTELLQTFELDPSFIEFLETQPVAPFGDIAAQLDALMRDGEAGVGGPMVGEDERPGTSASEHSERPGTASSDVSHEGSPVQREDDLGASAAFWRRSSVANKQQQQFQYSLQPPEEPYHVGQDSFFDPPADPLQRPESHYPSYQSHSPPVPAFGSSGFGGSFQPVAHRQSLDAQLAASAAEERSYQHHQQHYPVSIFDHSPHLAQDDWVARRDRGSDATIRGRQDSIRDLAQRHEEALKVLQSQLADPEGQLMEQDLDAVPEGVDPNLKYCYLTPEQAKDARLVEHIFRLGYGVSFEREPQPQDEAQQQYASQQENDFSPSHMSQSIPSY